MPVSNKTRYAVRIFSKHWTWYWGLKTNSLEEAQKFAASEALRTEREHQVWDRFEQAFISRHLPKHQIAV